MELPAYSAMAVAAVVVAAARVARFAMMAAEMVVAMVKQLRHGIDARTAREMNAKLQNIEGEADKLELERLRDLLKGNHDPKQMIFLHDLYGLLEKVIDRCRDAGNIIVQVALKYS